MEIKFEKFNEDMIVEKLNIKPLFDKLKNSINKKQVATLIIGALLSVFTVNQALNYIRNTSDLNNEEKIVLSNIIIEDKYKDPIILNTSQDGVDHIKKYEDIKLKPYTLGGMMLIGYGHKILPNQTHLKNGISKDVAEKLLADDILAAEHGVKRLFKMWKSAGIDIKVTQNQFDVMVSLAYSMGVGAFRGTSFVQALKQNDFVKASRLLKYTGISHTGHKNRRLAEYFKFVF